MTIACNFCLFIGVCARNVFPFYLNCNYKKKFSVIKKEAGAESSH